MAKPEDGGTSDPLTVGSAEGHLFDLLSKMEDPENREEAEVEGAQPAADASGDEPEAAEETAEGEDAEQPEEAEEQPPKEPEKPTTYRVKVDGAEVEVTLDEALKGYSRTEDYTRKTQALAEQRKAAEAEVASVRAQRTQYDTLLGQMDEALKEIAPEEPNWEVIQRDYPEQYTAIHARWNAIRQRREVIAAERKQIADQQAAEMKQAKDAYVARERERLFEVIPEWKDEKVATAEAGKVVTFARSMGFTDAEIKEVTDHRALRVMRLAALAHEAAAAKGTPATNAAPSTPKIKPAVPGAGGAPPVSKKVADQRRALDRLAKSGRVDDAAAAFLTMIPDR